MKTHPLPPLGLVALLSVGLATQASAGIFSNNIDMLVVAEGANGSHQQSGPAPYAAFDGGYIEAGDPIAGDTPPTAAQVSQSLQAALANLGYQKAAPAPSVVLTYHWGVLRIDHRQIRVPYGIKTNLEARIELVSTGPLGAEVENHILLNEKAGGLNPDAAAPRFLVGPAETVKQDARQPRIFVIVSAYDYQGLLHREAKLLWRAKLSAREQSGRMDEVIPALITGGSVFFGKDITEPRLVEVTPRSVPAAAGPVPGASAEALNLDRQFIDGLLKAEHARFSGYTGDN
jgi:hypothetical protein